MGSARAAGAFATSAGRPLSSLARSVTVPADTARPVSAFGFVPTTSRDQASQRHAGWDGCGCRGWVALRIVWAISSGASSMGTCPQPGSDTSRA